MTRRSDESASNSASETWRKYCLSRNRELLDNIMTAAYGESWRQLGTAKINQIAETLRRAWEKDRDRWSRSLCAVIYQVTGEAEKITELGFRLPWFYQKRKDTDD